MASGGDNGLSLSELFCAGWDVQKRVESAEIVTSRKDFDTVVSNGIQQLEEATKLVSQLGLFSKNEMVEEVSTTDLKYILLPALLGDLVSQLMDGERLDTLRKAQIYFTDYLQRCKDYAITTEDPPSLDEVAIMADDSSQNRGSVPKQKTLEQLSAERQKKIARLRAKKETEQKLAELNKILTCDSTKEVTTDEETLREHTLTLLKLWVYKSLDGLQSVRQEMDLLQQMKLLKQDLPAGAVAAPLDKRPRPPMKPFTITKDMLKDKVFGTGYPSLPTMTVEEFYEKRYESQLIPESVTRNDGVEEDGEEETDEQEEERLTREREFDEFKDVNRRGWGNRKNKG